MVTRVGNVERNASICCTSSRRSDVQPQSAQRMPSTWAAAECRQRSHFFGAVFMNTMMIKSRAAAPEFSPA